MLKMTKYHILDEVLFHRHNTLDSLRYSHQLHAWTNFHAPTKKSASIPRVYFVFTCSKTVQGSTVWAWFGVGPPAQVEILCVPHIRLGMKVIDQRALPKVHIVRWESLNLRNLSKVPHPIDGRLKRSNMRFLSGDMLSNNPVAFIVQPRSEV